MQSAGTLCALAPVEYESSGGPHDDTAATACATPPWLPLAAFPLPLAFPVEEQQQWQYFVGGGSMEGGAEPWQQWDYLARGGSSKGGRLMAGKSKGKGKGQGGKGKGRGKERGGGGFLGSPQRPQLAPGLHEAKMSALAVLKDRTSPTSDVLEAARRLQDPSLLPSPQDYTILLSALSRRGLREDSTSILEIMERCGPEPNLYHYNAVMSCFEASRDGDGALLLLQRIRSAGLLPDAISYNTAMSACGKAGDWRCAVALLDEMLACGVFPTVVSFSTAIDACGRAGDWEQAMVLLSSMQSIGIYPNVVTVNAALSALARGNEWRRALSLLDSMESQYGLWPDLVSFSATISACSKSGQTEEVKRLLQRMWHLGIVPDAICYSSAISAFAREGGEGALGGKSGGGGDTGNSKGRNARGCRNDVGVGDGNGARAGKDSPDSCDDSCIAGSGRGRGGGGDGSSDWMSALELLAEMRQVQVSADVVCFSAAMSACEKGKQCEKTLDLLDAMLFVEDVNPNSYCFNAAISACQHSGHWEQALKLLSNMQDMDLAPDIISFNSAMKACGESEDCSYENADALLKGMTKLGLHPTLVTYSTAMAICEQQGLHAKGLALLTKLLDCNQQLDEHGLALAARLLELAGEFDAASDLLTFLKTNSKVEVADVAVADVAVADVAVADATENVEERASASGSGGGGVGGGGGGGCLPPLPADAEPKVPGKSPPPPPASAGRAGTAVAGAHSEGVVASLLRKAMAAYAVESRSEAAVQRADLWFRSRRDAATDRALRKQAASTTAEEAPAAETMKAVAAVLNEFLVSVPGAARGDAAVTSHPDRKSDAAEGITAAEAEGSGGGGICVKEENAADRQLRELLTLAERALEAGQDEVAAALLQVVQEKTAPSAKAPSSLPSSSSASLAPVLQSSRSPSPRSPSNNTGGDRGDKTVTMSSSQAPSPSPSPSPLSSSTPSSPPRAKPAAAAAAAAAAASAPAAKLS